MSRTNGAAETAHRAFPFVVGLGVMAALLLLRVLPPPRLVAFVVLPVLVAALVGALVVARFPRGRAQWPVAKHGVAAAVAAAATVVLALGLSQLTGWVVADLALRMETYPQVVETAEFAAAAATMGLLAGWFAGHFERWVDPDLVRPSSARAFRNPRSWGIPGVAGVSVFLASLVTFASDLAAVSVGGAPGPEGPAVGFSIVIALIVGILSVVIGLTAEAIACRRARRRSEKAPQA